MCERFFLQLLDALAGRTFLPQLLVLNPAVVPIQILAHFADTANQTALPRVVGRQSGPVLNQKLSQTA